MVIISTTETKPKKRRVLIVVVVLIALLMALASAIYLLNRNDWYDLDAKSGSYEGKSQEEIIADLNRIVEEGMMNISIAATITFEDGTSYGEARIENIEGNNCDQKVVITLKDSKEVIYTSGALAPGTYLQSIQLDTDLEPGTYDAVATFTGYDLETHDERGSAAAEIRLVVLT